MFQCSSSAFFKREKNVPPDICAVGVAPETDILALVVL